jgi:hypothetical protein
VLYQLSYASGFVHTVTAFTPLLSKNIAAK